MKKIKMVFVFALLGTLSLQAWPGASVGAEIGAEVGAEVGADSGLKPGDQAVEFKLKNVDGNMVALADYADSKGVILIFTCNNCPYSKAYESRIIELHKKYAAKGFPVVAVNPNDDKVSKGDTFSEMKKRAAEKDYPFPYLKDETQEVYKAYGATRTPHIFLLAKEGDGFEIAYIGAIDDSAMDPSGVEHKYLEDAIAAVKDSKSADPDMTKAVGCSIKAAK